VCAEAGGTGLRDSWGAGAVATCVLVRVEAGGATIEA